MLILFALLVTLGAILVHTAGFSLGAAGIAAFLIFLFILLFFRTKKGLLFGLCCAGALMLGALTIWKIPEQEVAFGNRAFMAKVVSVASGRETSTIVLKDGAGVKYRTSTTETVFPGDQVSVRGKVEVPKDFVTDSGRVFPYQAYLLSRGVAATISFPELHVIEKGTRSIDRALSSVQQTFTDVFATYIRYPFDTVVSGMVLGVQGGITNEIKNLFRDTGTLHTLVLSGYNITLLTGILGLLFRGFPIKIRTVLSVFGILFLVGVSGAGVAALRAGIMGSLSLLAVVTRRSYDPLRGLMLAYLLFFFISPLQIFSDPGFHLSFLATAAIILLYPKIEAKFVRAKTQFWRVAQSIIVLSTFMPLIMLPYFMYFSGIFALSSPVANIFASLFVPGITIAGMILIVISFLHPLARFGGILLGMFVSLFVWILRLCAHVPLWQTPPLAWWGVLSIYSIVIGIFFRKEILTYLANVKTRLC